jgi:Leucine-rich repeat (LRR) protein
MCDKITSLPPAKEMAKLKNLKDLHLSGKQLNGFPKSICYLPNLEKLSITCKNIQNIPPEISKMLSLKELTIDTQGTSFSFPRQIKYLKRLKILTLQGSVFSEKQRTQIKQWLPFAKIVYTKY